MLSFQQILEKNTGEKNAEREPLTHYCFAQSMCALPAGMPKFYYLLCRPARIVNLRWPGVTALDINIDFELPGTFRPRNCWRIVLESVYIRDPKLRRQGNIDFRIPCFALHFVGLEYAKVCR